MEGVSKKQKIEVVVEFYFFRQFYKKAKDVLRVCLSLLDLPDLLALCDASSIIFVMCFTEKYLQPGPKSILEYRVDTHPDFYKIRNYLPRRNPVLSRWLKRKLQVMTTWFALDPELIFPETIEYLVSDRYLDPTTHDNFMFKIVVSKSSKETLEMLLRMCPQIDPRLNENWALKWIMNMSKDAGKLEVLFKDRRIEPRYYSKFFHKCVKTGYVDIVRVFVNDGRILFQVNVLCLMEYCIRENLKDMLAVFLACESIDPSCHSNYLLGVADGNQEMYQMILMHDLVQKRLSKKSI